VPFPPWVFRRPPQPQHHNSVSNRPGNAVVCVRRYRGLHGGGLTVCAEPFVRSPSNVPSGFLPSSVRRPWGFPNCCHLLSDEQPQQRPPVICCCCISPNSLFLPPLQAIGNASITNPLLGPVSSISSLAISRLCHVLDRLSPLSVSAVEF
jgi:hypothetical protein